MTDVMKLAQRLFRRIKWQEIPDTLYTDDLVDMIEDSIRKLYVISGRSLMYSDDKFVETIDPETGDKEVTFEDTLMLDEEEWVLKYGEVLFYSMASSHYDDLQSYTTDAMSVTHGDKPFKNIKSIIDDCNNDLAVIWTRMVRFNQLGVSG